jgi:hypothetical protein
MVGFFSGAQFNLVISFRYTPAAGELAFWCQFMNETSRILHDATDGTQSIGHVLLSPNSMGGADADIWVHPNANVWPNSTGARLWFGNEALDVSQDYMMYPTILAHELCHYLYDLRDEYNNSTCCQCDITTQASMMESYDWAVHTRWTDAGGHDYADWATFWADFQAGTAVLHLGQPTEFCHQGNHDATANNNQNNLNGGQSCWTYIANDANHNDIPYGLAVPGAAGPTLAPPAAPAATVCTELIPVQRFILVLDRSGSMAGAKITQLRVGANFWADYVNAGEELGLVTYSTLPHLDAGMSEVPAAEPAVTNWRTALHTIVDGLTSGGVTAIGDAMRAGLNDIIAPGRASSQVMILFTDGLQNWGAETAEQVLPDLVSSGVRCYTIGLGNDQDAALLANIANTTGARYFAIDGDLSPDDAAEAISEALIAIAGESREDGGIVSFEDLDGMAVPERVKFDEDVPPFLWPPEGKERKRPRQKLPLRRFTFPVAISAGSVHCTLGALWKGSKATFRVRIYDPDGRLVAPGPLARWVRGNYPYSFWEVDTPKPGVWQVEVSGSNVRTARFRTIGFEVHRRARLEVSPVAVHLRSGQELRLRARLLAPQAVPGAEISGWVRAPSGTWLRVRFVEHTGAAGDREEARLYTAAVPMLKDQRGQYLVAVDAHRREGSFEVVLDEMYARRPGLKDKTVKFRVPEIRRRAFLAVAVDAEGPSPKEPRAGSNPKGPWVPRNQRTLVERWKRTHRQ